MTNSNKSADWWLTYVPPKALPVLDVTPAYQAGQIIGFAADGLRAVVRVLDPNTSHSTIRCMVLAKAEGWWGNPNGISSISGGKHSRQTILIQDIGQDEPTDPDILYQFFNLGK